MPDTKSIFASAADISDAGLSDFTEKKDQTGVVLGSNPYTDKALLSDSMDNVLLLGSPRSGKWVNTVIPSAFIWKESLFCLDMGSHIWETTASYRKERLGQKVIKFAPLSREDSASWNPLAEIRFGTPDEFTDALMLAKLMSGIEIDLSKDFDAFWTNSSVSLLTGVFLHLYYAHKREKKRIPNLSDVVNLLCDPHFTYGEMFHYFLEYPYISPDEFMSDDNPFQKLYGQYIKDWNPFNQVLRKYGFDPVYSIDSLKTALRHFKEKSGIDIPWEDPPFTRLLLHPKVDETIGIFWNTPDKTRQSILSSVRMMLLLFQNPTIQQNTNFSDFCIRDLMDPTKTVSVYFCCEPMDIPLLSPLAKIFLDMLCFRLASGKRNPNPKTKKLRHLFLLLDNFTEFGFCKNLESALSVSHNYEMKFCLTASGMHSIRKVYGDCQRIVSFCPIRILMNYPLSEDFSDSFLSENSMVIQFSGFKPIRAKKFLYFKHKWFMDRIMAPPELSDTGTRITTVEELAAISSIDF